MAFVLTNLRSDARFLIFGDSTITTYGDTDLDRNIDRWYQTGIAWVLKANGKWQVKGEIATTDIVAGQREYLLPGDILKLNEVYIKTVSNQADYAKAVERDPIQVNVEPESYHPNPPEFDLLDNSIFIYIPEASITGVSTGLKIHYQSNLTTLTASDAPDLAEPFKRLLSVGAVYDYCFANEMWKKATEALNQISIIKNDLIEFYVSRSTVARNRITFKQENYN